MLVAVAQVKCPVHLVALGPLAPFPELVLAAGSLLPYLLPFLLTAPCL